VSRLPIRVRLALIFALAMAIVLGGAGWFVYTRVGDHLADALDQELRSRAQDVSALVSEGGSLQATGFGLVEQGESFAQLVDADGRVVDATPPLERTALLSSVQLARAREQPTFANRHSVPGLDEPARMLAVPVQGTRRVLIVGGTRENRAETLDSLRTAFLIGGPLALLLASLGGYLLAGAALRPIEAMRRRASEISSTSLDERLPVPEASDEVARLGETLNEMLTRIEDGVARERRFITDASHELRTPLTLLRTELELALRRSRSPEDLEQAIRSAAAESERLVRIANDLLLLAGSEQGGLPLKLEPIDVGDLLETVAGRFRAQAATADRPLTVAADEAVVVADRLRLEQALGNLLDNALRHGDGDVILTAWARNGSVEVHVLDHGRGFEPDFLEHAFERFSRGREGRTSDGSGLGLAIVETVARAHAGTAHVGTASEGGADVWIVLPASG
jgi:two-component system OmpR family sensor kinase